MTKGITWQYLKWLSYQKKKVKKPLSTKKES